MVFIVCAIIAVWLFLKPSIWKKTQSAEIAPSETDIPAGSATETAEKPFVDRPKEEKKQVEKLKASAERVEKEQPERKQEEATEPDAPKTGDEDVQKKE